MPYNCTPRIRRPRSIPGGDVAPLIAAADLQLAAKMVVQVDEVVRLQQHVAELGVAHAAVGPFEPRADGILGQHHVDREVLAHVAKKIQVAERCIQSKLFGSTADIGPASKSRNRCICCCNPPRWPAAPRPTADSVPRSCRWGRRSCPSLRRPGDRPMPGTLEPAQHQQRQQMAHMQALGRRIEPGVQGPSPGVQPTGQNAASVDWWISPRQTRSA
jgi:hypothetical protein